MARFAAASSLVLVLACVLVAAGSSTIRFVAAPASLHSFMLRVDERVAPSHTYAEMPAFAWQPVRGATGYELQLANNQTFSDVSILYEDTQLSVPVASVQLQLPWMNGDPYALWVHVRAIVKGSPTPWSKPFGFNMGWKNIPEQEPAPAGLIRWTPVTGATAYQVWFTNINRVFMTLTNVADEREYWTLHPGLAGTIRWRVRAVRRTANLALPTGVAITPYGPWSDPFTTLTSGSIPAAPLRQGKTLSDVESSHPHALMPGFTWNGTNGLGPAAIGQQLWRVYVFSDKRCVNQVMAGSLTGAPAWAPRATQALVFPTSVKAFQDTMTKGKILKYGDEGPTYMADLSTVTASENSAPTGAAAGGAAPTAPAPAAPSTGGTTSTLVTTGQVELPDSGWPAGRYWWTVVPVQPVEIVPEDAAASPADPAGAPADPAIEYHDTELPQDACAAGRVWPFALRSAPVTTAAGATPYASGLVTGQRLVAAAKRTPKFVQLPLITWKPAIGAQSYEVELSHDRYPWVAIKKQTSVVTSAVLPLTKSDVGTWYYRVRGVNPNLPANAQKMTWSSTVSIAITGNQFTILH
jgi:hypothetical protein